LITLASRNNTPYPVLPEFQYFRNAMKSKAWTSGQDLWHFHRSRHLLLYSGKVFGHSIVVD
jgi:hypothetical protein